VNVLLYFVSSFFKIKMLMEPRGVRRGKLICKIRPRTVRQWGVAKGSNGEVKPNQFAAIF
jgi:hypothetical protein